MASENMYAAGSLAKLNFSSNAYNFKLASVGFGYIIEFNKDLYLDLETRFFKYQSNMHGSGVSLHGHAFASEFEYFLHENFSLTGGLAFTILDYSSSYEGSIGAGFTYYPYKRFSIGHHLGLSEDGVELIFPFTFHFLSSK